MIKHCVSAYETHHREGISPRSEESYSCGGSVQLKISKKENIFCLTQFTNVIMKSSPPLRELMHI